MQLIDIVNGAVWSVQATRSLRAQKNADGTYNFEGDSCGAQYVNASDIMILPDEVEIEVSQEINPDWYALEIPLEHLLAPTAEGALADALG